MCDFKSRLERYVRFKKIDGMPLSTGALPFLVLSVEPKCVCVCGFTFIISICFVLQLITDGCLDEKHVDHAQIRVFHLISYSQESKVMLFNPNLKTAMKLFSQSCVC